MHLPLGAVSFTPQRFMSTQGRFLWQSRHSMFTNCTFGVTDKVFKVLPSFQTKQLAGSETWCQISDKMVTNTYSSFHSGIYHLSPLWCHGRAWTLQFGKCYSLRNKKARPQLDYKTSTQPTIAPSPHIWHVPK